MVHEPRPRYGFTFFPFYCSAWSPGPVLPLPADPGVSLSKTISNLSMARWCVHYSELSTVSTVLLLSLSLSLSSLATEVSSLSHHRHSQLATFTSHCFTLGMRSCAALPSTNTSTRLKHKRDPQGPRWGLCPGTPSPHFLRASILPLPISLAARTWVPRVRDACQKSRVRL
jgi:hypothetical protein